MEIRDARDKEWFWLDNQYLNGYAKILGVYCTVVYLSLCRHADNKTQQCFPSMKLIAEENGMSIKTVERATKSLEEWGIIKVLRSKKTDGTQANNVYTLTAKKHWKDKPTDCESIGNRQTVSPQPTDSDDSSRQTPVLHNKTNINNTQLTIPDTSSVEVAELIKSFEIINPASKKFYGNKTQRSACEFLINEYGFDRVKIIIERTLPKTNTIAFFPSITTPLQLQEKWAMLESAIRKNKNKADTEKIKQGVCL